MLLQQLQLGGFFLTLCLCRDFVLILLILVLSPGSCLPSRHTIALPSGKRPGQIASPQERSLQSGLDRIIRKLILTQVQRDATGTDKTKNRVSSLSARSSDLLLNLALIPPPEQRDKAGTPGLKSSTPTPRGDSTPGPSSTPGIRPSMSKPPTLEIPHPPSEEDF